MAPGLGSGTADARKSDGLRSGTGEGQLSSSEAEGQKQYHVIISGRD